MTLGDREKAEALHERILSNVRSMRAAQVALGRDLREMRERGWILFHGVTEFPIYCERKAGLSSGSGLDVSAGACDEFAAQPWVWRVVEA